MGNRWFGYLPLIVVLAVGLTTALFFTAITGWIKANRDTYNGRELGFITHSEGSVRRVRLNDLDLLPAEAQTHYAIHDGDLIQSSVLSHATLELLHGDQFTIPDGSGVRFDLWDAEDVDSPLYLHVVFGQVQLNQRSSQQEIYIVAHGQLFMGTPPATAAELGLDIVARPNLVPPPGSTFSQLTQAPGASKKNLNPDSLSTAYLNDLMASARVELQNCWQAALQVLHDSNHARVTLGLNILSSGEIQFTIPSSSDNATLDECVLKVLRGLRTRPFNGDGMRVEFPILFKLTQSPVD